MGMMYADRCEKCGHDGICRYQEDMKTFQAAVAEMMNRKVEASHFNVTIKCPDYYEKTYSVRKGEKR